MATQYETPPPDDRASGWAVGGLLFAATVMTLVGVFQVIAGLTAIIDDEFFVVTRNYTFDLDVSVWGWIHLVCGGAVLVTGLGLFSQATWAGAFAIVITSISAIINFFFIPYYPLWSLLVIALNVWVIWSVTRPGVFRS
jgi:hypothetical protein